MSLHSKVYAPFFALLLLLPACATNRANPLLSQEPDTSISEIELKDLGKNSAKLWAKRQDQDALFQFIQLNEKTAKSASATQSDLVLQARAYYILGEYFSKTDNERSTNWEMASNWAEKALTFNPKFKELLVKNKMPAELALDVLTKKDIDALYWFAASLGRWVTMQGLSSELKYKDRIKKMIDRVAQLNSNYFYGAVYRYYGVYYALLPEFKDEDLKNSRKNFEKAVKRYPEYFANHVLYSYYYARKMDDQALFKRHLQTVVQANAKTLHDVYPEQLLEQNRAKFLLSEGNKTP